MKFKNVPKKILLLLLFPMSLFLFYITALIPSEIDLLYSQGINRFIIENLSLLTGLLPFSLAELGFLVLSFCIPISIIVAVLRLVNLKKHRIKRVFTHITNTLIVFCVIYFLITILWTLNYNRRTFADIAKLDIRPASTLELSKVCNLLISKANLLRPNLIENEEGVMKIPGGYKSVFRNAKTGFQNTSQSFPELSGNYGGPKAVFFSKYMSYSGIIGVYCPFTGEANIDVDIPAFTLPSTVCHEMAHQHGFAREDEANYIAWLTCKANPDLNFQYSGTLLALTNSMNALYRFDKEKYYSIQKKLYAGILRDFKDHRLYWQSHKGTAEKITTSLNDAYLKANKQKDGVHSYGRMVDLLIAEYRKNGEI